MFIAVIALFMYLDPAFGARAKGEYYERVQASPNFKDEQFKNLIETVRNTRGPNDSLELASYFFPPDDKNPLEPLPTKAFNAEQLLPGSFVWLGHSTVLFNNADTTASSAASNRYVLFDPVFYRASPIPLVGNPFAMVHKPTIAQMPNIDFLIISHDHYDHLDHQAIAELEPKTQHFLVPLGVAAHLLRWGVPADKIHEFDWYDDRVFGDVTITFAPSRHFSGRALTDHFKTLWGSWAVKSNSSNVYFSGDGGYFDELKTIGERLGPFDIAFVENGAYNKGWRQIHMMPEESVQTSLDVQARHFFPIHWSKFDLAQHQWKDPIERAAIAAEKLGVSIVTPEIGEIFTLDNVPSSAWWELVK